LVEAAEAVQEDITIEVETAEVVTTTKDINL